MKVTDKNGNRVFVNDSNDLADAIEQLESKKLAQEQQIKDSIDGIKESLSPGNLAKSAFNKITENQSPLQLGFKVAAVLATTILAKKAVSKKDKHKRFIENDDEQLVEVRTEKTPLLTSLALTAAANFIISKIPVVSAYTAATVNQFVKKSD